MKYSEDFIVELDRAEYRRLVELCVGQHFEVTDIATYALIKAFSKLTGSESLLVDLAIRARTGVFEDLDISNLFGQISEFAAVPFELESGLPLFDQLNSLREQRARVPNAGLGLKALKFAHKDPEVRNRFASGGPQVILNFDLLDYTQEMPSEWAAGARPCSDTDGFDDVMQQIHIRGSITADGGLSVVFWYRPDIFDREDVNTIAETVRSVLMRLAGDREVTGGQAMERA